MVNDENIIEIGNMASADEALILKIIDFNQKGYQKKTMKMTMKTVIKTALYFLGL